MNLGLRPRNTIQGGRGHQIKNKPSRTLINPYILQSELKNKNGISVRLIVPQTTPSEYSSRGMVHQINITIQGGGEKSS